MILTASSWSVTGILFISVAIFKPSLPAGSSHPPSANPRPSTALPATPSPRATCTHLTCFSSLPYLQPAQFTPRQNLIRRHKSLLPHPLLQPRTLPPSPAKRSSP